jgi:hypothetical protein
MKQPAAMRHDLRQLLVGEAFERSGSVIGASASSSTLSHAASPVTVLMRGRRPASSKSIEWVRR